MYKLTMWVHYGCNGECIDEATSSSSQHSIEEFPNALLQERTSHLRQDIRLYNIVDGY